MHVVEDLHFLDETAKDTATTLAKNDGGTEEQEEQEGCSANSFLINDGVCDEVTNNALCLYDGKDCCRQIKLTHYCQDCTCRLSDTDNIILEKLLEAQVYKHTSESDSESNLKTIKIVEEVKSPRVCGILCIDEVEENPAIDSLTFTKEQGFFLCKCTSYHSCLTNKIEAAMTNVTMLPDSLSETSDPDPPLEIFMMMARIVNCCKKFTAVILFAVLIIIFLSSTKALL